MRRATGDAIRRGLSWLAAEIQADGEVRTYWSEHLDMRGATHCDSPFFGGVTLWALQDAGLMGDPAVASAVGRAARYLVADRRPDGHYHFLKVGIAADLDDTCLLNALLARAAPRGFDYPGLARRVAARVRADGSFPTWIDAPNPPGDTDPVVVANVLRFLDLFGLTPPSSVEWLRGALGRWAYDEGTRYYASPYAPLYFACTLPSRLRGAVLGPDRRALTRGLVAHLPSDPSPLDEVYLLHILTTLGDAPRARIGCRRVLDRQQGDGSWPVWAAFQGYNYWGSPAYGAALALHALRHHQRSALNLPGGL